MNFNISYTVVLLKLVEASLGGLENTLHWAFPGGSAIASIFSPSEMNLAELVAVSLSSRMTRAFVAAVGCGTLGGI